jgi:hypothetical protein
MALNSLVTLLKVKLSSPKGWLKADQKIGGSRIKIRALANQLRLRDIQDWGSNVENKLDIE